MDNFVIGNMVWNAGLVAVAGMFVKKWMKDVETGRETNATAIKANDKDLRERLAKVTERTTSEIKEAIHENRVEYARQSGEIKESIDKLSDHVAVANGRTSKLEAKVATQIALCQERNSGTRDDCKERANRNE